MVAEGEHEAKYSNVEVGANGSGFRAESEIFEFGGGRKLLWGHVRK